VTSAEDNKSLGVSSKGKTDETIYRVTEFALQKRRITICKASNILGIFWVSTKHFVRAFLAKTK
jgi:hypothetical protein